MHKRSIGFALALTLLAAAGCRHEGVESAMEGRETTDFSDLNPDTVGWQQAPEDPGYVPPPPPATDTIPPGGDDEPTPQ